MSCLLINEHFIDLIFDVTLAAMRYANICARTKFDENTFIGDRDKAKNPKSAVVLNFTKKM